MAVSDHVTAISKLRAKILTVDPSQRIVEAAANDAYARRISVFDVPQGFVWPREGEEWSIYEENGYWRLGSKFLNPEENVLLQAADPGHSPFEPFWPGDVKLTSRTDIQPGWLLANGGDARIDQYPELYKALGSPTGHGTDNALFSLPNITNPAGARYVVKT